MQLTWSNAVSGRVSGATAPAASSVRMMGYLGVRAAVNIASSCRDIVLYCFFRNAFGFVSGTCSMDMKEVKKYSSSPLDFCWQLCLGVKISCGRAEPMRFLVDSNSLTGGSFARRRRIRCSITEVMILCDFEEPVLGCTVITAFRRKILV